MKNNNFSNEAAKMWNQSLELCCLQVETKISYICEFQAHECSNEDVLTSGNWESLDYTQYDLPSRVVEI